ncbi:MAG: hypothetical protein F8N39_06830 [Clostridiaceae bacterium]|nr:hypothetical protein [Clostridiaceae bacterium]
MKKNLSLLIALALSLTVNTAVFADAANSAVPSNTNIINTSSDTITLTLDDAINNLEKNNTELKLKNDEINSLYKQFDIDHNFAASIDTSAADTALGLIKINLNYALPKDMRTSLETQFTTIANKKLLGKMAQEIKPLSDEQEIKDAQNARDERLNVIKFDLQRQYMNVLNSKDQIDNINKTLANINEKIGQLKEKIKVGQAASNALDPLNVQKSQLEAQNDDIKNGIDQSLLKIKQYLNIDLNKTLNLVPCKKAFVKFDDKDISSEINDAIKKDYVLSSIQGGIDIAKKAYDINLKYSHNDVSGQNSFQISLAKAQNGLITANAALPQALWGNYYALKSKENAVETQKLTEKSAQDTYDKLKKNFEAGMTDKVTLDSSALELDKQKNLTERTVNEYMIAQDEFNYMLQGHASAYKNMSTQSMGTAGIDY